jgi:hypothetical protein
MTALDARAGAAGLPRLPSFVGEPLVLGPLKLGLGFEPSSELFRRRVGLPEQAEDFLQRRSSTAELWPIGKESSGRGRSGSLGGCVPQPPATRIRPGAVDCGGSAPRSNSRNEKPPFPASFSDLGARIRTGASHRQKMAFMRVAPTREFSWQSVGSGAGRS